MRSNVGDRVGAVLSMGEKAVHLLGYGVYQGDLDCPILGGVKKNPCILLDSGDIVWGCQCWWGDEKEVMDNVNAAVSKGAILVHSRIATPKREDISQFDPLTDPERPVVGDRSVRHKGKLHEIVSFYHVVKNEYGAVEKADLERMENDVKQLVGKIDYNGVVLLRNHSKYNSIVWALFTKEVLPMPTAAQTEESINALREMIGE